MMKSVARHCLKFKGNHRGRNLVVSSIVIGLIILLYTIPKRQRADDINWRNGGESSVEVNSRKHESSGNSEVPQRKNRENEKAPAKRPFSQLRFELTEALNDKEAKRSRLLLEKEGGGAVSYLVGVDPPSTEEIKEMRQLISNLQKECAERGEETQEFDDWIGNRIEEYDAFGSKGKRVVLIRIPEDTNARMSAIGYPTSDFDSEVSRLDTGGKFNVEGLTIYFTDPAESFTRFKALIK